MRSAKKEKWYWHIVSRKTFNIRLGPLSKNLGSVDGLCTQEIGSPVTRARLSLGKGACMSIGTQAPCFHAIAAALL